MFRGNMHSLSSVMERIARDTSERETNMLDSKLSEKAIQAIRASIEVWVRKRDNPNPFDIKLGMTTCPLCTTFAKSSFNGYSVCGACPVSAYTSQEGCGGTPYYDAAHALDVWRFFVEQERKTEDAQGTLEARNRWRGLAQEEILFLLSLLPKKISS